MARWGLGLGMSVATAVLAAVPEDQDPAIVAALTDPRSPDRVVVREWKSKEQMRSQP